MMAERGVEVSHTTILRWVVRYVPEFEKRWNRYARRIGSRIVQKQKRHSSSCCAVVVVEHPAEALAPLNGVMGWGSDGCGLQESIFEPLMIALGVIVRDEMPDRVLKRGVSEEDHPAQTLFFD